MRENPICANFKDARSNINANKCLITMATSYLDILVKPYSHYFFIHMKNNSKCIRIQLAASCVTVHYRLKVYMAKKVMKKISKKLRLHSKVLTEIKNKFTFQLGCLNLHRVCLSIK